MDVLFLTSELPVPPRSGGTIKSAALLAHLGRRHHINVMCFARQPPTSDQARWIAEHGVDALRLDRARTPLNLLRSYRHRLPLSVERNRSPEMAALVARRLGRAGHDAVFVDGWLMAQYLPPWFHGVKLLHEHNAEHVMWRRQIALDRNPVRRALLRAEHVRVREYEASILRWFDIVFAVSEPDRRALAALGVDRARLHLLVNVADQELLSRRLPSPDGAGPVLLFLGSLGWEPNVVGLERFLRLALPRVRQQVPGARLVIAGRGALPRLRRLAAQADGAELLGPVDDPEPLYRSARVFIDPSRGGSGSRVKVLNAMARGVPVVATPEAAEGLEAAAGEHLLVADDPASMSEAISRLMTDRGLWLSLSRKARQLVRRRYVPSAAFTILDEVLAAPGDP